MRMLFGGPQTQGNLMKSSTDSTVIQQHRKAIERLLSLKICTANNANYSTLTKTTLFDTNTVISINSKFQEQLKTTLCETGIPNWVGSATQDSKVPDTSLLIKHSHLCWSALLRFMIGKPTHMPSTNMAELLVKTNLMTIEDEDRLRITNSGFKFLLKDTYTQIWTLLLAYIESIDNRNLDKKEVLSFLFQLSFLSFGKGYPCDNLSPTQKLLLQDLREFGIIYQRKGTSKHFYPTQLAITLSTGVSDSSISQDESLTTPQKYIVIEPNYRLYAYTKDELQLSILSLFVKMKYRLPNLAMGVITRESIRIALMNGITANEIISYINQHAHASMLQQIPVLPETVVDQVRLWEQERNRASHQRGVLYESFPNEKYYQDVVKYTKDLGVWIWSHDTKKLLMVTEEGHEELRKFLKNI